MKNPLVHALLTAALILFLFPLSLQATTYHVGPARPYTTLQQVAGLLSPGDSVLVDGDTTYPGGIVFSRPGSPAQLIIVHGVRSNGRRPIIDGGINGVEFRTSGTAADHYIFEGFEVRNASFRGVYHHADDLTLRDLLVHNCNNGLMGADNDSGTLLLEYCEFYANGAGASAHQIYMATDEIAHPGSVFRMQFCYMHDGAGGNNVKSRSERNEIYYNWIEGAFYHELELIGPDPAGGVPADLKREDSDIVGNVLRKKATAYATGTFNVTRFGGDGTGESKGRYRVVNNTFIMGTSAAFRLFDSLESVEMHNNVFVRSTGAAAPIVRTVEAAWTSGEKISGQNNWVQNMLTTIPAEWIGTIQGDDPVFRNLSGGDFSPANGSPLINSGTSNGQPPPGLPFPNPLFPPALEPPVHMLLAPGSGVPRQINGAIDIGAFENKQATGVPETAIPEGFRLLQNHPNPFNPSTVIEYTIGGDRSVHLQWTSPVSPPVAERQEFRPAGGGTEGQVLGVSVVSLIVFDVLGRDVAVLVNEQKPAGSYTVQWDGTDGHGRQVSSGVYFYRLSAGAFTQTKRMVLIK